MGFEYETNEITEVDDMRAYEALFKGMRQAQPSTTENQKPQVKVAQTEQVEEFQVTRLV